MSNLVIANVKGREVLDSRGNPTVEAEVCLSDGTVGRGASPSGASTGEFEALELRDKDMKRYVGKGVLEAVNNINSSINARLTGMDEDDIWGIDKAMIELDGTKDKSGLGANACLAVSIACVRAFASARDIPLYQYIRENVLKKVCGCNEEEDKKCGYVMPVPMMNIINGGAHAGNYLDFQEFMIIPKSGKTFSEALRMGAEVYHYLKEVLAGKGYSTAVGDEGGFAPNIKDAYEALDILSEAVLRAGYEIGKDISFAMDAAASELFQPDGGVYYFPGESEAVCKKLRNEENNKLSKEISVTPSQPDTICTSIKRTTEEMIEYYEDLTNKYPLISIEDPLDQNDWEGWKKITDRLGSKVQLVGDDLFVTNTERLKKGIDMGCGNAILIKPNQIGTVSETINAILMAKKSGYNTIISHRSGETEDAFIADLAVAVNAGQIKTGATCRGERIAKYNQLLRIEDSVSDNATIRYGTL
ncbi:MAG: phosphopyruvate hydratase [Lachnospira sp.]